MLALGVRTVPVIARGEQFVFGQNFEDIAEFVGSQGGGHTPLPPEQLIGKWLNVVRAVDAQFSVPHALVMALVQEPLGHHAAYRTDRPGHRDRRSP